jgi:hypothetical protein
MSFNNIVMRIEDEPIESFDAIQYYFNCEGRTVHKAYQQFCNNTGNDFNKAELQMWMEFHDLYNWENRVNEKVKILEKESTIYAAEDQLNDLIKFRKRQSRLSIQLADTTQLLLEKAQEALINLDPLSISPSTLPKYIEAAARISTLAQNAEAQVLALTDLIEHLNESDNDAELELDFNNDDFETIMK